MPSPSILIRPVTILKRGVGKDTPQQMLNAPNGMRDQSQEVCSQRLEYAHRHIVRDQSDQQVWKLDRAEASPDLHKCGRSQRCVMGMRGGAHFSHELPFWGGRCSAILKLVV